MSYSLGLTSINDHSIDVEKLKEFCSTNSGFKFDDSKSWTNLYDQIVLFKINENWDFVCGLNNGSKYSECATPQDETWEMACKLAEGMGLYISGEENEVYYIPGYGKPKKHIDIEEIKSCLNNNGDLALILEE